MYKPQEKELRYLVAHLCWKYTDEIQYLTTRWDTHYNDDGEIISQLPLVDIMFKG